MYGKKGTRVLVHRSHPTPLATVVQPATPPVGERLPLLRRNLVPFSACYTSKTPLRCTSTRTAVGTREYPTKRNVLFGGRGFCRCHLTTASTRETTGAQQAHSAQRAVPI